MKTKTLPASSGYFNKKMISILERDTKQPENKTTTKSTGGKKK